jgi:hypothetical protein
MTEAIHGSNQLISSNKTYFPRFVPSDKGGHIKVCDIDGRLPRKPTRVGAYNLFVSGVGSW